MGNPGDPELKTLVDIWMAKVLRDEKRYEESRKLLKEILLALNPKENWHAYFFAKTTFAFLHLCCDEVESAEAILVELQNIFEGHRFKSTKLALDALAKQIATKKQLGTITLTKTDNKVRIAYADKVLSVDQKSFPEKLLLVLSKRRTLNKARLIQALYDRKYNGEEDDKLIYYYVHSLRKYLKRAGLPAKAIVLEEGGYRLVPEVNWQEETL